MMMGEAGEPDSHRPKLDKKSMMIIAKKGDKPGKKQSYADYLISRGEEYAKRREDKAAELKDVKDQIEECTFKPKVLNSSSTADPKNKKPKAKTNAWDHLYSTGLER